MVGVGTPAITTEMVRSLVAEQFPSWAHLDVRPVDVDGWDNRSFRLGDDLLVRLPSADAYASQAGTERRWLPVLRPHLPFPIPEPVGFGRPGCGFPRPWSVLRWLAGEPLGGLPPESVPDHDRLADELATFLRALRSVDAAGGPPAGERSFHRGGDLAVYDGDVERSLASLAGAVDESGVREVWTRALRTRWEQPPVWLHGDVAPSNLLVANGRLAAVIDFGQVAVGDPACDLVIAWTWFDGTARTRFVDGNGLDAATVDRARGWAIWKALLVMAEAHDTGDDPLVASRRAGWSRSPAEVVDLLAGGA